MGATTFVDYSEGKDAKDAYNRAVREAQYKHGTDPYNGTISTTSGFFMVRVSGELTEQKIDKFIDDMEEKTEKRDRCGCLELKDSPLENYKKIKNPRAERVFIFSGWAAE